MHNTIVINGILSALLLGYCLAPRAESEEKKSIEDFSTIPVPYGQPAYPVGRYAQIKNLLSGDKKTFDVVFDGDSVTDGWRGMDGNGGGAVWKTEFAGIQALNIGIQSEATGNVLYRIQDGLYDRFDTKVYVLMIGWNNLMYRGQPLDMSVEGYTKMITKLREKLPNAKFLLLAQLARDPQQKNVKPYNARIQHLADYKNILFMDMNPYFREDSGEPIEGAYRDGVHLLTKGYGIWAATIKNRLNDLLSANSPKDLKVKFDVQEKQAGKTGELVVTLELASPLPAGSQIDIQVPCDFSFDRHQTKLNGDHRLGDPVNRSSILHIPVNQDIRPGALTFTLSHLKTTIYKGGSAAFLAEIRDSGKQLTHRGLIKGIEVY